MRFGFVRAIAYATVFLVAAIALSYVPQLPDRRPAEVLITQAAVPSWRLRFDTLGSGESLQKVLRRGGLSDTAALRAIQAASTLNERRIPAGMPITIRSEAADSAPSEVTFQVAVDKIIRLKRNGGGWSGAEEKLQFTTDTIVVSGTIQTNVYAAVDQSAADLLPAKARTLLTWALADVYQYKIDMTRELQRGDAFTAIAQRSRGPNGAVRIDNILAASFTLSGTELKAIRYTNAQGDDEYFDDQGRSMRAEFLKYPVAFNRISSGFGNRFHPILGYTRAHKGTDYAADAGTPVKAVGDGVVLRATWDDGYGNLAEIRHPNGFVTRYGHMKGFAKGIHAGARVKMNDIIGYVGMTGLATGPHLHFEVLIGGEQHNPQTAFPRSSGAPIAPAERPTFIALRDKLLAKVERVPANSAGTLAATIGPH